MSKFTEIFDRAISSKNYDLVRTFICLFPELAASELAEEYLRITIKAKESKHFKVLFKYGDWWLSLENLPREWQFLNEPKYKAYKAYAKEKQDQKAEGFPVVPASWAAKQQLNDEAYEWLANALYVMTGYKPSHNESTIYYEDKEDGKKAIRGHHLRMLIPSEPADELARVEASLQVLGVKYHSGMIKGNKRVVTIPQKSFRRVLDIIEAEYKFDTFNPSFEHIKENNDVSNALAAHFFDQCFNLKALRNAHADRMLNDTCNWATLISEKEQASALRNIKGSIKAWVDSFCADMVPEGRFCHAFDQTELSAFKKLSSQLGLPLINTESNLEKLSLKQKADLFRLCTIEGWGIGSVDPHFSNSLVLYRQYARETLSTFLPESIQQQKEITAGQEIPSFTPSYSLSQSPPQSQALSSEQDDEYKISKVIRTKFK